jgi:UDP-glucose 4-epimerase
MTDHILVTGGAGYIGSHTCVELLNAGYQITVLDNYCNSNSESLNRVERITGKTIGRITGDVRDVELVTNALRSSGATAVIHFAGLKAVGESVEQPLRYFDNNVVGSLRLLEAMQAVGVKTLVFSSSATVYGNPQYLPLDEQHPLSATSPYGRSKLMVEDILRDAFVADSTWRFGILRYFNPVGAHASGQIGEDPCGVPNNLLPFVAQVAVGRREFLNVWGDDYNTPDGTGVRDYIHVMDLARGHLASLQALKHGDGGQCSAINLGTGNGYSVLEVVQAFRHASGQAIAVKVQARRAGDTAANYAATDFALARLGWRAECDLARMCEDTWRWQSQNPNGYAS